MDAYKEKIQFLDCHIGELIREIDDGNTMIMITVDHGDVFGERRYFGHPFIFYNEMINVPLFIKFPSEMKVPNTLCRHPVSTMGLLPTIVDLLKLEIENQFDGHTLLPLIGGQKDEYQAKYIVSELGRKYACIIKGDWKLIANYAKSSFELYNWADDPREFINIVNQRLDIRQELEDIVRDHITKHKPDDYNVSFGA